jgi:RNA polymerase sigma-70 factor (ECF subfamily)
MLTRRHIPQRDEGRNPGGFTPRTALPATDEHVRRAVAAAGQGDPEAVRLLYIRFADNVYGYVRSIVGDEHEAEDVTQEVFTKLIRVIGGYEDRGLPFHSWILRVAHNVAIDHLRRRRSFPCEDVRGADEADADPAAHERCSALQAALAGLPEDQRQVLVLRHVLGLSPAEIGERLGKSESAVHGLHHRGRLALQAALRLLGWAPSTARRAGPPGAEPGGATVTSITRNRPAGARFSEAPGSVAA